MCSGRHGMNAPYISLLTTENKYMHGWEKVFVKRAAQCPENRDTVQDYLKLTASIILLELFVSQHFIITVLLSYLKTRLVQSSPEQTKLVPGNSIIILIPANDALFT